MNTNEQYPKIIAGCTEIFIKKNKEYGASWKLYLPTAMTDKLYIKAKRILTLHQTKVQKIKDSVKEEFEAILNYSMCALVLLEKNKDQSDEQLIERYNHFIQETQKLMEKKNHDYGEAWRDMRISSMANEILVKLARIKKMEDGEESERDNDNFFSNYMDCANYAIFALIKISEGADPLK